jgi:hypothetical protein
MLIFWVVMLCGLAGGYNVSDKCNVPIFREIRTDPHSITIQMTTTDAFIAMKT